MAERRVPAFRALLGYQINSMSEMLRRGATLRLRRGYGVRARAQELLEEEERLQPGRASSR